MEDRDDALEPEPFIALEVQYGRERSGKACRRIISVDR
jgi:hypothetical protein